MSAITGGVLHTGGKLGSFLAHSQDRPYKYLPLLSRAPALISLGLSLPHPTHGTVLPLALVVANLLWARADVMLMPHGRVRTALGRLLLVPPPFSIQS